MRSIPSRRFIMSSAISSIRWRRFLTPSSLPNQQAQSNNADGQADPLAPCERAGHRVHVVADPGEVDQKPLQAIPADQDREDIPGRRWRESIHHKTPDTAAAPMRSQRAVW